jgi:hypothetical protein
MYLLRGTSPLALCRAALRLLGMLTPIIIVGSFIKVHNLDKGFTKIHLLNKLKLFKREPYYKHELDYFVVEMLDVVYPSYLRYGDIEKEISSHLSHKVPSATLSFHLWDLFRFRHVLDKRKEKNRHTYYSLTKEFKDALDKQKKEYPANFAKKTLSLENFSRAHRMMLDWGVPADD